MKPRSKIVGTLLALGCALGVALAPGCGRPTGTTTAEPGAASAQRLTIGASRMNLSNEFIVMLHQAMLAKAGELGVALIVTDAQRSAEWLVQQVESIIALRVDAIILNPCEVDASASAVENALAAGIPIGNVNSETRTPPTAFIGSRDEESARLAMEHIVQRLGGRATSS